MCKFEPDKAVGFRDAQCTFELWRMKRAKVMVQPSYNNNNQAYNTINLDSALAMQVWTAADYGLNENSSGIELMSYQNARCHTLSLNAMKTVVNTQCKLNLMSSKPIAIMPVSAWLDTSEDQGFNRYNGFQLLARMPGVSATNYLPELQVVFEIECEFMQPAYQNRPTSFESEIIGSILSTIPDGSLPNQSREYKVVSFTLNTGDHDYRLERVDGQAGSLNYTMKEMWEVYIYGNSGKYFDGRNSAWTGPPPRRPLGFTQ